ncbi:hypothetical protein [Neotabrizicola sp. VNH66]|uniref:hypothetical protein n=1 Tax=Neotabrizicola sp. VNH66 TaxID=3400918 RepID=UPI003C0707B3
MPHLTRRSTLLGAALVPLLPHLARAEAPIGLAQEVSGAASLTHMGQTLPMAPGDKLSDGDTVATGEAALALLILQEDTKLNLGPATEVVLTSWLADVGGEITLSGASGGALVFDRDDSLPPVDLVFETGFGEIGVRGTRFFAGPSRGVWAVFCQRGQVAVTGAGVTRVLNPGDGVELAAGAAPGEVVVWGAARVEEAFASLGLTP